ncbi:UbiD family decarboxylase [Gluconobacter kondonii]|uniref:UbiD family decarboxylase n=1 Tax=Gluconobacter kondonii TaxID=941463 RepID=UPI00198215A7|nr:UbiD family decarboxylase [Gluconobacter kondonii]
MNTKITRNDAVSTTRDSEGWIIPPIDDLRSAIDHISKVKGEYRETDHPVDPNAELAGVYRYIGAGGTVMRPTRVGPAMTFNSIKGYPDARILVGMMASRKRVSLLLGAPQRQLGLQLGRAVKHVIPPVIVAADQAPCQETVYRASDPDFDIRTLLPAPTNTPEDAGPFFCMGLLLASDPDDATISDVTIHRLCVQGRDELSVYFVPGRHIDSFRQKAEAAGKPLPISINMGLDPAIYIGACFEAPTTPLGFNELGIAGGLRGKGVELVNCVSHSQKSIARAEIVIEGEILPGKRVQEDQNTKTGKAMPEFPGYDGVANPSLPVIRITAVTMRKEAILQTIVGPGEEHVNLVGIPTEASIHNAIEVALPGFLQDVYAHSAGGGKLLAILQIKKVTPLDDGKARQAALIALGVYRELKNIIIVDEDVDLFDTNDVLWAMQTRYQGDISTIVIPGIIGHPLDPSQAPEYSPFINAKSLTSKTIFDCTVPFSLKSKFVRAKFLEVDPRPFAPDLFDGE